MDRLVRLAEFWNWLPAFRAVAETGHLKTAARQFGVGPSALSRSIGLLEERLGTKLFDRVGRNIRLNAEGERFLAAVRAAMRRVDDGYEEIASGLRPTPLRVSTVGVLSYLLLPVLADLRRDRPDFVTCVLRERPDRIAPAIHRGELDLALLPDPPLDDDLLIDELGAGTNGIYCGPGHALFRSRKPDLDRVLEHDFAGPVPSEVSARADGWPPSIRRRVTLHVADVKVAVDACAGGHVLAVLPDFVAASLPATTRLRRLPHDVVPPTLYHAVRRGKLGTTERSDAIVHGIRDLLGERNAKLPAEPAPRRRG